MKNLKALFIPAVLFVFINNTSSLLVEASTLSSSRNLIIGGSTVPRNVSYKWFVRFGGKKHVGSIPSMCGGVLVSPEFVLTSARCLPLLDVGEELMIGARCGGVAEDIGGSNCGEYYEMRSIKRRLVSNNFVNKAPFFHDLAIVMLNETSTISPIVIDDGSYSSQYTEGKQLWVIGFGAREILQNEDEIFPYELEHAEVKYGNQGKCFQAWEKLKPNSEKLDNSMMCAGSFESSACLFDTGGPLYDSENNVLVGIARWEDSRCSFEFGSIFNRLSEEFGKINFKICQLSSFPKPILCNNNPSTPSPTTSPIARPPSCNESKIYVAFRLRTDHHGETDNRVTIVDTNSKEEIEIMTDLQSSHEYFIEKCLPCGQYNLTIYDEYGDGLLHPGGFSLSIDGETIASNWRGPGQEKSVIGYAISILFNGGKCSSSPSISPSDKPSVSASPTFYSSHPSQQPSFSPTQSTLPSYSPTPLSCSTEEIYVTFAILTDIHSPKDNSAKIINLANDEAIFKVEKFTEIKRLYEYKFCAPCGLYQLTIYDSYGDGILDSGYFSLTVDGVGVVLAGAVEGKETKQIFGDSRCTSDSPSHNLSDSPSLSPSVIPTTRPTIIPTIYSSTFPTEVPTLVTCASEEIFVVLEIATDAHPEDTNVKIVDMITSEILVEIEDFAPIHRHKFVKCIPCGIYEVSISDKYGDGIRPDKGYYSLNVDREIVVLRGSVLGYGNSTTFGHKCKTVEPSYLSGKPSTSPSMNLSVAPSPELSNLPSIYPTIRGGLSEITMTFYQTFESNSPLLEDSSSALKFAKIMESYTIYFAGNDKKVQTTCSVKDTAFSESFTLALVKYDMTFKSLYNDVFDYAEKFEDYVNNNLDKVADDLQAFDILKALNVYQIIDSPTRNPTESSPTASPTIKNINSPTGNDFVHISRATYYQEFGAASFLDSDGKTMFEGRIEYYARFLFKQPENEFQTLCSIVDQTYIESQERLNIMYTIEFQSLREILYSHHDSFRDFINANLPKLTNDLSTLGILEANSVLVLHNTDPPSTSPTKVPSPPCPEENIHAELTIFTDDKASKVSVEVRNISGNDVIQKVTDFRNMSQKIIDFCLPCHRYFLSILVASGEKAATVFDLSVDEKVLVQGGMVYGFGTAVIVYSDKCS